jgi:hypothetical protein
VDKTIRLGSRDPVASGVKCGPHGGKNSKMKSVDGFLVEPQNQGRARTSWEPSHEWRLAKATSSSRGLRWFNRKPLGYSAKPQSRGRRPGVAARPKPALLGWRTGLTGLGSHAPGASRRRTCVRIARLASRLREVRSPSIRLMVLQRQIPKVPLMGVYPSLCFRCILVFRLSSI